MKIKEETPPYLISQPTRRGQTVHITPARLARERAELSLAEAAKRAHCSVAYIRRLERHGGVSWVMGMRLAHIYNCNCHIFLKR